MELPMANFHRLTIDGWEYVPERYPHVAWDSSFDEIDEEHAFEIIEALEKKKFAPCRIPHCWRCREFKINGNPAG
jgi:hypothetical protein